MGEFTKDDSKILKGIAILFMLGLHLYNRINTVGYYTPWIMVGENPLIYYLSFIFDACVPIYCFCAGYAAYILKDKKQAHVLLGIKKLLVNYWVVLFLTCVVGLILKHPTIPGDVMKFLSTALLYDIGYVGAWWFMQTYLLLTITSKLLIKLIDNLKSYYVFTVTLILYFIAYYFRIMNPMRTDIYVVDLIISALVLYGTSLLPYIIGIYFKKYMIVSKIRELSINHNNLISIFIIILCVIGHMIVKSMIVAPFIAIILINAIALISWNEHIKKVLIFFGNHSTNIWLVHMQLYMIFFKDIIFSTNTVIGCMAILLVISIGLSYIINFFINHITQEK